MSAHELPSEAKRARERQAVADVEPNRRDVEQAQRQGGEAQLGRQSSKAELGQRFGGAGVAGSFNPTLLYNQPVGATPSMPLHGPSDAHAVELKVPSVFTRWMLRG